MSGLQVGRLGGILLETRGGQEASGAPLERWFDGWLVVRQQTRLMESQCLPTGLNNPLCYFGLSLI